MSYWVMTGNSAAAAELIDQAKVAASGGFPYRIKQPGSYRLTSNLCTVKDLIINAGGSGISVGSSSVISGNVLTGGNGTGQVGNGITTGPGSRITGNISTGWGQGIMAGSDSLISGNSVYQNLYGGIFVTCPANLIGNISRDNPPNISKSGTGCTFFNDNAP